MDSVRNLVDALIDGDSIQIQNSFNAAVSEKISSALDDYRVQVAQNMFNPELELEEETKKKDPSKPPRGSELTSHGVVVKKQPQKKTPWGRKIARERPLGEEYEDLDEETLDQMISEVLSKDASAGKWISDFVHSDNPKFAGKSKEKRKQMALAAYYAKQRE